MKRVFVVGLSRSGTTLLTTILDSHPDISMGYELIPAKLGSLHQLAEAIETAQRNGAVSARDVSRALPVNMGSDCGVFIKRATRALIPPELLIQVLLDFSELHGDNPKTLSERVALATAIVDRKQTLEGTKNSGFKVPITMVKELKRNTEHTIVFSVIRDPRDMFASQLSRKMITSANSFSRKWNGYASQIQTYKRMGLVDLIIRYEDLTTELDTTLELIRQLLGLTNVDAMRGFYKSKASVHAPGQRHVNADALSQKIFTSSIGRWKSDISEVDATSIEKYCKNNMQSFGYATSSNVKSRWLPRHNIVYKLRSIARRFVK